MNLDPFAKLAIIESQVLDWRLEIEAMFIPISPRSFLSLIDEVLKVIVGPISEHLEQFELSNSLSIRLDLQSLRTIDHILGHADLQAVLYDVIMEAPSVKIGFLCYLISDTRLYLSHLPLLVAILQAPIKSRIPALSLQKDALVLKVHVQLKHILSRQLRNMLFIALNLVLDAHNLVISPAIQPSPQCLYLLNPGLMRDMRRIIRIYLLSSDWQQVFQSSHF